MAKYDHGGGCACGLYKVCCCDDAPKLTLVDGSPVTDDHRNIKPNGQQKDYVVLNDYERTKKFVKPLRRKYIHDKCGVITTVNIKIAETFARDPDFYSATFCTGCGNHFPLPEFTWLPGDNE